MKIKEDLLRYSSNDEIEYKKIFIELGFFVAVLHRLSSWFSKSRSPIKHIGSLVELVMQIFTGCHISKKASIGSGIKFPHPTGIVIGERALIGLGVTIYQNVTIGQKNSIYPEVGDGVVIYPGAVIVGDIKIGSGSVIGPNCVVYKDTLPGSVIVSGGRISNEG